MASKVARRRAAKKVAMTRKRNVAKRSKAAKKAARTRKRNAARRSRTRTKIAQAIRTELGRYPTALLC
ncbi:MAG: hypothetical protein WEC35_05585 [Nitrosopumilaceae archaeon]